MSKLLSTIFIFAFLQVTAQQKTGLILNEIMFNPVSGQNEFIELFNLSETDAIDLTGYRIKYYTTTTTDAIISAGYGTLLPPLSYAVVLEGDYDFVSGIYNNLIPPSALIVKISDNAFGSSGMANTSDRPLWLISPAGDTLDVYTYSADNQTGFSDEKKVAAGDSAKSNWANSLTLHGTPGSKNSVTPSEHDLVLSSLTFNPAIPIIGETVDVYVTIKNSGSQTASAFEVKLYNDENNNSLPDDDEQIYFENFQNLSSNDSLIAIHSITDLEIGSYNIIAEIMHDLDENNSNNRRSAMLTVYPPGNNYNDIVINEIMYAPSSGEPEWVEVFNRTEHFINLKKWRLTDNSASVVITNSDVFLSAGEYIVLSRDSSVLNYYSIPVEIVVFNLPALNNTGDAVVLKDSLGILIDSLSYLPSWGGNTGGRSLERISIEDESTHPNNWGSSISRYKATPGTINSITPKNYDLVLSELKSVTNYAIVGDTIQINAKIVNKGLMPSNDFTVKLFKDTNRDSIPQADELLNSISNLQLNSQDSIVASFLIEDINEGNNYFIAYIETVLDEDTSNNISYYSIKGVVVNELRNDLVINEFMYAPLTNQPEWIEIFNRSEKIIEMKNYRIADNADTVTVINQSILLYPQEYLVIAADSSIKKYFNIPSKLVVKNFPALNNTGDKIILLDSLNRTIDSLEYKSSWGGSSGRSLERIDPDNASTDSSNWKTSINKYRASPGYINSVTKKDYDPVVSSFNIDPQFPVFGDDVTLYTFIKNLGEKNTSFIVKLFEDTNRDSLPDQFITGSSIINLSANDSVVYNFDFVISNLQNARDFFAIIFSEEDQDTSNNTGFKSVEPGYPPNTIVINEIMYTPSGGEPEWIELFNTHDDSINLKDWTISDILTTPSEVKISEEVFMQGNSYLIISRDTSIYNYHRLIPAKVVRLNIPNLNNDFDGVVLKDKRGLRMDSVFYQSDWGGTSGYSLERRDKDASSTLQNNWGSSIDIEQSTPGRINSITVKEYDLSVTEVSFEPRFPVLGDNVSVSAKVKNFGQALAESFSVQFYILDEADKSTVTLLASNIGGMLQPEDSVNITSSNAVENLSGDMLIGVNIIYELDEDTLNNYTEKKLKPGFRQNIILINEVMYAPAGGEPEWFELVNVSSDTLNLKDWSVSDVLTTPTKSYLTNEDFFVAPGEYLIISRSSSIQNFYPEINSKIIEAAFGTLGNTSDGIMVYDFRDAIIDSFFYKSAWGGRNGYSLERVSLEAATNDSSNWATSLSISKATPGAVNSLFFIPPYNRHDAVINEIMFDPDSDNNEFIELYVLSEDSINIGGWRFEDERGNYFILSDTSFILPPQFYFIFAADSLVITKYLLDNNFINTAGSSTLGLVNTGELILLKDVKGNTIDSVWYSDKWHNKNILITKNRSLERINPNLGGNDPLNWSTSVNAAGATPGEANSIFTTNLNKESNISVSPNPFSPDNDGFEDFTIINYNLTQTIAQIRVKIFDSKGRLVRTLANNSPSGSSGSIIFDGLNDDGNALRMGIYIVFLEALNDNSGVVENLKTVVVVARRLN
jgi:hypothetical protein